MRRDPIVEEVRADSFTLAGNGVQIQIVKVVGGNYGIRKVK